MEVALDWGVGGGGGAGARVGDVELSEHVARGEDHLGHVGWVPGAEDQAPVGRVCAERVDDARELVDALAGVVGCGVDVGRAKVPPLEAVNGAEVAGGAVGEAERVEELARAVAVPDFYALGGEGLRGSVAGDEPEELGDDGFGEDAFCGEEREDRGAGAVEGEFEWARGEDGVGACAGAGWGGGLVGGRSEREGGVELPVLAQLAFFEDFANQVKVLVLFVAGGGGRGPCRRPGGAIVL